MIVFKLIPRKGTKTPFIGLVVITVARSKFLNSFPTNEVQYTLAVQNQVGATQGDENAVLISYARFHDREQFLNSFPEPSRHFATLVALCVPPAGDENLMYNDMLEKRKREDSF